MLASCGWRVPSERLRADHRGASKISAYQFMTLVSMMYLALLVMLLPEGNNFPPIWPPHAASLLPPHDPPRKGAMFDAVSVYGRSRVTGSILPFQALTECV